MEEGGGERERVTDTSSSRVESFYRSSAQPTWLSYVHAVLLPFHSVPRFDLLPRSSFYIFYIKLMYIFRDCAHEEQEVIIEFI